MHFPLAVLNENIDVNVSWFMIYFPRSWVSSTICWFLGSSFFASLGVRAWVQATCVLLACLCGRGRLRLETFCLLFGSWEGTWSWRGFPDWFALLVLLQTTTACFSLPTLIGSDGYPFRSEIIF